MPDGPHHKRAEADIHRLWRSNAPPVSRIGLRIANENLFSSGNNDACAYTAHRKDEDPSTQRIDPLAVIL